MRRRLIEVEVRVARDPDGRDRVLLQLEDGWVLLLSAADARQVAAALTDTADQLDRLTTPTGADSSAS